MKRKVVPPPSAGSAESSPPWAATIERQMERPMPHAVGLGGDERLEQMIAHLGRQARSGVGHRDFGKAVLDDGGADGQPRWSGGRTSMASMALRQRLIMTCWTWMRSASTGGQIRPEVQFEVDLTAQRVLPEQVGCLAEGLAQVDGRRLRGVLLDEPPDAPDDVAARSACSASFSMADTRLSMSGFATFLEVAQGTARIVVDGGRG